MYLSGYYKESINEGSGLRAVLFISGCKHACEGCFNSQAWNFRYGEEFTLDRQIEIIEEVKNNPLLSGITLCGGDPFFSAKELIDFVDMYRREVNEANVWAYSGFTFEEIMQDETMKQLLERCDVLIDGKFILEQKDTRLKFRGSKNQRIIDVKASLDSGSVQVIDD